MSADPTPGPAPAADGDVRFGEEPWRPARQTRSQRAWRPGRRKQARSVQAMFASTVLCLEAVLLFFLGLALSGLHRGEPSAPWFAAAGVVLAVVAVLDCAIVRRPAGVAVGWVLQLAIILVGVWEPAMAVLGVLFALTWWYAITKGRQIDVENARRARAQEQWEAEHPEG